MLAKHSSRSVNGIARRYQVPGDQADGRKTAFWPSVVGYLIESFASYAASMHPTPLVPVEPQPDEQNMPQPRQISRRERRAFVSLVSTTVSQDTSSLGPEQETDPTPPAGYAIGSAGDRLREREREIEKAVAALAKLDDRTLRDLGIPHRSHIERTVRYCRDC
jgi:uncharacterized protein YjiS (DUF1127 family)